MKHMKSLEGVLQDEANDAVNDQHKVSGVIKWLFMAALGVASLVVVPLTILNMNSICQPLERARLLAQAIAGGDLSQHIEVHGKDEVADLQHAQKAMQEGLGALVSQVRYASESVATASQEIASGNQDLSERTEKSASSVQDTVGSLAELTENVQQTAHAAQNRTPVVRLCLYARGPWWPGGDAGRRQHARDRRQQQQDQRHHWPDRLHRFPDQHPGVECSGGSGPCRRAGLGLCGGRV